MDRVERRLRAFILLGIVTAVATFMFVSRSQPAAAASPLPSGDLLSSLSTTYRELGLPNQPSSTGLRGWWQRTSSSLKLQLTLSKQRRASLYLDRASAELLRLDPNASEAAVRKQLGKFSSSLQKAATSVARGNSSPEVWAGTRRRFLNVALNQQALLGELAHRGSGTTQPRCLDARAGSWPTITGAVTGLNPATLDADLDVLIPNDAARALRFAVLLEEWRATESSEFAAALTSAVSRTLSRLSALSPAAAAALAERLQWLTPNVNVQLAIASAFEQLQPSLVGLTLQLQRRTSGDQAGAAPAIGEVRDTSPLSPTELAALEQELGAASTRDEILAVRQRWYSNDELYAKLRQHHRLLIDQLERKLQQALGQLDEPVPPPTTDSSGQATPLPLQTLTPEQQAMAETYLRQLEGQYEDLPPPATP